MFVTAVKILKAAVLAAIATDVAFDALVAANNWRNDRKQKKAAEWDAALDARPAKTYDPIKTDIWTNQ